jgi:hypothetical protein
MSWFDQQPQPGTTGVQGGIPSGASSFLPGDQIGPDGMPLNAQNWPVSASVGQQATPQNGNYQQTYQQIMGGANDQASLLAHQQELEAAGFHISPPNASGAISKIQTPDGQWVRVIGEGEGHPVWIPQGSGTGGSAGSVGGMADGSLLTPWTEQFQAPANMAPFQAPDPTQIANDPNYQFQLGQGLQGVERGAAAKGTLLTGGTLKSLDQFGQGLASAFSDKQYNRAFGEYGMAAGLNDTAYNRALGQYNLNRDIFQQNQDRPYTKLSGLATLGKPQTIQPPTG